MNLGRLTQLNYEKVVDGLSIGKGTKELHGRVSEIASHATAGRLVWGSYVKERRAIYDWAFPGIEMFPPVALFYCANTVMLVMNASEGSFQQEGQILPFATDMEVLYRRYGILKERVLEASSEKAEESSVGHSTH